MSAKARAAARKQRDKWKNKRWYTIRAPRHPWNFRRIGETLGETDEQIIGRVYEMTQQEFSGDFTKMHVILRFKGVVLPLFLCIFETLHPFSVIRILVLKKSSYYNYQT